MRYFLLLILLWQQLYAQPSLHNRIWYFGAGHTLQFTPTGPQTGGIPAPVGNAYSLHSGNARAAAAVCNDQGMLQFFTQIQGIVQASAAFPYVYNTIKVFDRNGQGLPNGNIEANAAEGSGSPLVVPHPANAQQYYLFYIHNAALIYSLVDMSLNNGLGDIVATQKNIKLSGYGTVIGRKFTAVKGCGGKVWLVIRSRIANQYLSFAIDSAGIHTQAVASTVGTLPVNRYHIINGAYHGGALTAANSSNLLAAGTDYGTELYDFEPCSGKLKNARMLDTLCVMGVCFSPDDSKLYVSSFERMDLYTNNPGTDSYCPLGRVYQYNLQQANVLASRTLLLENPIKVCLTLGGYTDTISSWMGDINRGQDDKLYIASNTKSCKILTPVGANPVPPSTSVVIEQVMHRINQPNALGMASIPQYNAVLLDGPPVNATGFMLPHEIISANNQQPDTLKHPAQFVNVCFAKTYAFQADTIAACYHWDDGSDQQNRVVDSSGTYWVQYFKDCTLHTDTYKVTFIPLPQVPQLNYGCPNEGIINIPALPNNQTSFTYALFNSAAQSVATITSTGAVQFTGLAAGAYTLNIKAATCDTTLQLTIDEFPIPALVVSPSDTAIYYGDTLQLQVSGALLYAWSPAAHLDTATKANPMAWPRQPTLYEVIGINAYGCRATAYARVHINYEMPTLLPNAFTPNGDGLNDVFRFEGISFHKLHVLRVVNRYGQIVFESDNPQAAWDGTFKGKPCDAGVYFYYAELVRPDGKVFQYRGDVSLLR